MTYKYYLVAMIIALVVLYIATNLTQGEHFDPKLRISDENIKLIADTFADKFSSSTFANVISPCWRDNKIKNIEEMIKCVTSYNKYYENVLSENMFDLYRYIKSVEDTYVGFNYAIDSREEEAFALIISHSYKVALSVTLNYIKKNRPVDGFDELVFLPIFKNFLRQMLTRAISLLYIWNPLNMPE